MPVVLSDDFIAKASGAALAAGATYLGLRLIKSSVGKPSTAPASAPAPAPAPVAKPGRVSPTGSVGSSSDADDVLLDSGCATPQRARRLDVGAVRSTTTAVAEPLGLIAAPASQPSSSSTSTSSLLADHVRHTGKSAAAYVAYGLSDQLFVYHSGAEQHVVEAVQRMAAARTPNVFGRTSAVTTMATRAGAGNVVVGTLRGGAAAVHASVFVSTQSLPMMLPALRQMATARLPCVLHAAAQRVDDSLALTSDYSGVFAVRDTGVSALASYTVQEAHDMALAAHLASLAASRPVLHFFDGAVLARTSAPIATLDYATVRTLLDSNSPPAPIAPVAALEAAFAALASAPSSSSSSTTTASTPATPYSFFEYHGSPTASAVVVVLGTNAASLVEAAAEINTSTTTQVGVLLVRVYRPWSLKHFVAALPTSVRRLAVLQLAAPESKELGVTPTPLLGDLLASLHSPAWTALGGRLPSIVQVCLPSVSGASTSPSYCQAVAVFKNLAAPTAIAVQWLDKEALASGPCHLPANASRLPTQQQQQVANSSHARPTTVSVWGTAADNVEAFVNHLADSLAWEAGVFAHTHVGHDWATPGQPTRAHLLLDTKPIHATHRAHSADLVLVLDPRLLASHPLDIAGDFAQRGCTRVVVLVQKSADSDASGEESDGDGDGDDVSALFPPLLRQAAAKHAVQIDIVDAEAVMAALPADTTHAHHALHSAVTLQLLARQMAAVAEARGPLAAHLINGLGDAARAQLLAAATTDAAVAPLPFSHEDWMEAQTEAELVRSNSNSAFVARLATSASSSPPTTASTSSTTTTTLVKAHEVYWNVLFDEEYGSQEQLWPTEHEVFRIKLTKNQRLTPLDYDRNVFHLEFDISGTGLHYDIGDALGVYGHNDAGEVQEFLDFYGLDGGAFVSLTHSAPGLFGMAGGQSELLTVSQMFEQRLDIFGKPGQKFYAALAGHARSKYQALKLKWLGSDDKEGFKLRQLESYTFADVLREFDSARPSLTELIDLLPPIKPRHYSISSSMKMDGNSVHLLVVAVDWVTPKGRKRYGQCTRYLAGLNPATAGGDIFVAVDIKPSVMRLPEDPRQPVIGAALGTGLAPFRAFIQERAVLKARGEQLGPMILYFGARYRAQEFLYGDDLEQAERDGIVELRLAFSRDTAKKVYIQHKIVEDKDRLSGFFLNNGGHFYLCGPTWPVPDVKAAICEGLERSSAAMNREQAEDYIEQLKDEGRYILEVY